MCQALGALDQVSPCSERDKGVRAASRGRDSVKYFGQSTKCDGKTETGAADGLGEGNLREEERKLGLDL